MGSTRPRPGRPVLQIRLAVLGLLAIGGGSLLGGCSSYSAERAQFESPRVTLQPLVTSPSLSSRAVASASRD